MSTDTGIMAEKLIALVTNGCQYAGPAALFGLKHLNCRIYVHDQSFSDEAQLEAFASAHNGVIPLAGSRLSVANEIIRTEGRLDILIQNPSIRGERHVTDDDDVDTLDTWLTDARTHRGTLPAVEFCGQGNAPAVTGRDYPYHVRAVGKTATRVRVLLGDAGCVPIFGTGGSARPSHCGDPGELPPNYLESKEYYPPDVWDRSEKKKELAALVPVGRLNTAGELGNLIGFLAGGPTQFLTGSTIKIDGGALVQRHWCHFSGAGNNYV